ncbi:MAG TPA: glycosyltransferase family 4 protein [Fibrobacteria bacterium]|nr:glycosyltransferase family 4 protein [Fibrobacteria bacterium]
MNKTILLIGNHPPPFGGVPTHIRYLAPHLVANGWTVHVLAFTGIARWGLSDTKLVDGYTIHRPAKSILWIHVALAIPRLGPLLRRLGMEGLRHPKLLFWKLGASTFVRKLVIREKVSLISAYHATAGLFGAFAAEELGIPLVTTIFGELYAQPEHYRSVRSQVAYMCRISRRLLSCSSHCADSFRAIGMRERAEAVHYGIDTRTFNPGNDGSKIRQTMGISPEDVVVGYVGRMEREMGLHVLLESIPLVLAANPAIRFLIVGKSATLTESASDCSARHPGSVFVMSDASFTDLPLAYAAATLVVVPSINERACLGLAIVEAAATGKPVIVSDVGGGPEVVDPEIGFLVPPGKPDALSQAIITMASDSAKMREMGRKGREKMAMFFDKETTNRKMESIFMESLGTGSKTPIRVPSQDAVSAPEKAA